MCPLPVCISQVVKILEVKKNKAKIIIIFKPTSTNPQAGKLGQTYKIMAATAIYSVTMVLWKETAFPLCRTTEKRWKRNVVSRVSSVIVVIRLPISCVSSMAISCHVPAVSMANGQCVLANLEYLSILFCAVLWAAAPGLFAVLPMGLSKCVWYCHVSGHWLSSHLWQESGPIWAFVFIPHQADWLLNGWHPSSLDCCPRDVIQILLVVLVLLLLKMSS